MIAESFNSRTRAAMEVALERACEILSASAEEHATRRYIASKIIACAEAGDTSPEGLTEAGRRAALELRSRAKAS